MCIPDYLSMDYPVYGLAMHLCLTHSQSNTLSSLFSLSKIMKTIRIPDYLSTGYPVYSLAMHLCLANSQLQTTYELCSVCLSVHMK
jgi:hypothetical protein